MGVKMIAQWFLLLWVGLVAEVTALIIAPIVVLFTHQQTGRLPYGFYWMETHDALLPEFPAVQGFTMPTPTTWWGWYWQSLRWLERNRAYRFSSDVMGVLCVLGEPRQLYGNPDVTDESPPIIGSFVDVSHQWVECYNVFTGFGHYWQLRIGYKMRWARTKSVYAQHVVRLLCGQKIIP